MLTLSNVSFAYPGSPPVLKNLNLVIKPGECVGLIGQNGAGKSTLFGLLSGLLKPNQGLIELDDAPYRYDPKGLRRIHTSVGYIFQEADSMLLTPSVYEELSFGPLNQDLSSAQVVERIERVSSQLAIEHLLDKSTNDLSGGEKKLVSLGAVLTMDPMIILADEPTSFIDSHHTKLLEDKLSELHAQGKTVFVSSHDLDFLWRFAERFLVLHQGELLFDGTREELFLKPEVLTRCGIQPPYLMSISQLLHELGVIPRDRLLFHRSEMRSL